MRITAFKNIKNLIKCKNAKKFKFDLSSVSTTTIITPPPPQKKKEKKNKNKTTNY